MIRFTYIWQAATGLVALACAALLVWALVSDETLLAVIFGINLVTFSLQCWTGASWRATERATQHYRK